MSAGHRACIRVSRKYCSGSYYRISAGVAATVHGRCKHRAWLNCNSKLIKGNFSGLIDTILYQNGEKNMSNNASDFGYSIDGQLPSSNPIIDWNDFRVWVKVQADADRAFKPDHVKQCAIATYLTEKGIPFNHVDFSTVRGADGITIADYIPDDIAAAIKVMAGKSFYSDREKTASYAELVTQFEDVREKA